jgi:hypothetical protein
MNAITHLAEKPIFLKIGFSVNFAEIFQIKALPKATRNTANVR